MIVVLLQYYYYLFKLPREVVYTVCAFEEDSLTFSGRCSATIRNKQSHAVSHKFLTRETHRQLSLYQPVPFSPPDKTRW